MLLVRTTVKPSPIHGLGLFAAENIAQGTRIWRMSPGLDLQLDIEKCATFCNAEITKLNFHGFISKKTGKFQYSFDDVRYINHDDNGNVTLEFDEAEPEYPIIAKRDIQEGEELTQNYSEFE